MASGDLVLQFGLEEGRHADAVLAAQALIDWVHLAKEAALAIDPGSDLKVELLGRDEGSLRNLLRLLDSIAKDIHEGAGDYPYLKKTAIGLATAIVTSTVGTGIQISAQPKVQQVELSSADRALLKGMQEQIERSPAVATASKRFFKTVERDPAITTVQIANDFEAAPVIVIPRSEFPERSGLWSLQEEEPPEETRRATWSVVLLRASFTHTPASWSFSRDGLPFSARMDDPDFLAAIAAKTVPITLQEGVLMQVEVEYRERLVGQVWQYVDRTRRVVRVLSPRPLPVPAMVFVRSARKMIASLRGRPSRPAWSNPVIAERSRKSRSGL